MVLSPNSSHPRPSWSSMRPMPGSAEVPTGEGSSGGREGTSPFISCASTGTSVCKTHPLEFAWASLTVRGGVVPAGKCLMGVFNGHVVS